jgi:hypothetical protein
MTPPPFAAPAAAALQAYEAARETLIRACMDGAEDQLRAGVPDDQVACLLVQAGVPPALIPAILRHASD